MTSERWLFLFSAVSSACAVAAFLRVDISTFARLLPRLKPQGAPKTYTRRDVIISIFIMTSFVAASVGFALTTGRGPPRLSESQERTLVANAAPMRTFLSLIAISSTNGDPDTELLAHDIAEAFNRAGIEPVLGYTRPDSPDETGIIICVKDFNKPPLGVEELKATLKASDITFKVQGCPSKGFDYVPPRIQGLVIWVAPAPLS